MEEYVILVNEKDQEIGKMEKLAAHKLGLLHRAFSVFIFNAKGEMLLQQRAKDKYHSPLLWTNTCCSHPKENETYETAAHRRLQEEMGFDCTLTQKFDFIYKTSLDNNLYEHELDHVFTGTYDGEIIANSLEVNAFKWISMLDLQSQIKQNPEEFTVWFKIILEEYLSKIS